MDSLRHRHRRARSRPVDIRTPAPSITHGSLRLDTVVDQALDRATLQDLLEERQLVHDAMDASRVQRVREKMERTEARRLQPHYIKSFFREGVPAARRLGPGNVNRAATRCRTFRP